MKNFLRAFFTELKRSIFSVKFPAMVVLAAAAYFVGCIEELKVSRGLKSADVLYFFELMHNIGSFTMLSVLCCTVLNCTTFLRDRKSGYYRHCVIRSGKKIYAGAKFLSCVISGGAILALGEILFVIALSAMKFPLVSENSSMADSMMTTDCVMGDLLRGGYTVGYFAAYALFAFAYGALWSGVGIAVSVFFEDYYAASFSPYIISYSISLIGRKLTLPSFFQPDTILIGKFNLGGIGISLLGAALYLGSIIFILGLFFIFKAKRRFAE